MYIDAHFHLADYLDCCVSDETPAQFAYPAAFCCSAHERVEYTRHRSFANEQETPPYHATEMRFFLLEYIRKIPSWMRRNFYTAY